MPAAPNTTLAPETPPLKSLSSYPLFTNGDLSPAFHTPPPPIGILPSHSLSKLSPFSDFIPFALALDTTLDHLPHTVLSHVLQHLTPETTSALASTCKKLRENVHATASSLTFTPSKMFIPRHHPLPTLFPNVTSVTIDLSSLPPPAANHSPLPPPQPSAHLLDFLHALSTHNPPLLSRLQTLTLLIPDHITHPLTTHLANLLHTCTHLYTLNVSISIRTPFCASRKAYNLTLSVPLSSPPLPHLDLLDRFSNAPLDLPLILSSPSCRFHLTHFSFNCQEFFYTSGLYLPASISGPLSASLALLPSFHSLRSLFISPCLSPLPLHSLTSLTSLDIRVGRVQDPEIHATLLNSIASLTLLQTLRFETHRSNKPFPDDGQCPTTLPPSWSALTNLTSLSVSMVVLTPESGVWSLTCLQSLSLDSVWFSDLVDGVTTLQSLTSLTSLVMTGCDKSITSAPLQPLNLDPLTRLSHLELEGFATPLLHHLPPSLTSIQVSASRLNEPFSVPVSWPMLHNLKTLGLHIYARGLAGGPNLNLIAEIPTLEQLSLELLPPGTNVNCLDSLTSLTSLLLCGNGVRPFHWPTMSAAGRLQTLSVDMLGIFPPSVPPSLTQLRVNVFGVESAVVSIPSSLTELNSLLELSVTATCSWLSGVEVVKRLTSLELLEMNGLVDASASCLDALTNLTNLTLCAREGARLEADWPRLRGANRLKRMTLRGFSQPPKSGLAASLSYCSVMDKAGDGEMVGIGCSFPAAAAPPPVVTEVDAGGRASPTSPPPHLKGPQPFPPSPFFGGTIPGAASHRANGNGAVAGTLSRASSNGGGLNGTANGGYSNGGLKGYSNGQANGYANGSRSPRTQSRHPEITPLPAQQAPPTYSQAVTLPTFPDSTSENRDKGKKPAGETTSDIDGLLEAYFSWLPCFPGGKKARAKINQAATRAGYPDPLPRAMAD